MRTGPFTTAATAPFANRSLLVAILYLLCQASQAQENQVSLRFLSFPTSVEAVKAELRLANGKTLPIVAPSHECSTRIQVASPGSWSVGETTVGPDGDPVFIEYGRTPAATSKQQLLLVIRKGGQLADGLDLVALDEGDNGFGGGRFLFMNACKVPVAGELEESTFVLRPGQHRIIKPETKDGTRSAHAMFYFRKDKEVRPFFSSRWPVNPRARSMVFFYHDPENRRIRMHTVRDFR
jgi:hypothetical protein